MNFDAAFRRISELNKEKVESKEILELYQNILEFQRSSFERTRVEYEKLPVSLAIEKPLLHLLEEKIDEKVVSKLFSEFFEFISLFGTSQTRKVAKEAAESKFFNPPRVKETLMDYISAGKVVPGIPPEFLHLSILSVAPILFSPISEILQKQLPENFGSIECPYCGSKAQVGYFKKSKEGKRYLICPVCYGEWPIKRDICAYCGNEDLEEHYYLLTESKEDKHIRLDICDKCKHYIKTVDERILDEAGKVCSPLVEDLATPYLDIKALEEGYQKINKNLFGF